MGCGTTPCMVKGAGPVIESALKHLNTTKGHVTPDGLFCVTEVECLGACSNAPMMQVNNEWFYEDLTADSIVNVIEKFRNGEEIAPGPQTPLRKNCEGPEGRSVLIGFTDVAISRDFAGAKQAWLDAKVKVNPP